MEVITWTPPSFKEAIVCIARKEVLKIVTGLPTNFPLATLQSNVFCIALVIP